jgi:hypothetical protein
MRSKVRFNPKWRDDLCRTEMGDSRRKPFVCFLGTADKGTFKGRSTGAPLMGVSIFGYRSGALTQFKVFPTGISPQADASRVRTR